MIYGTNQYQNPYPFTNVTSASTATWFATYRRELDRFAVAQAVDDLAASLRKLEDYLHELADAH